MSRKKEEGSKYKSVSFFSSLFYEQEEQEEVIIQRKDNSFSSMARQLREQKEAEAKETKEISDEVTDYLAGRVMDVLHLTGTALGNRIHDMLLGSSSGNEDSNE